MNCKEVCEKMYDYIEHQLLEKDAKYFEEHMKGCTSCQEEYYRVEKLIVKLKNIKDIEPPKELKNKILITIKEEKKKSKILYFRKYSYIAATIVIFVGGLYTLKNIDNNVIEDNVYNIEKIKEDMLIDENGQNLRLRNISEDIVEIDENVEMGRKSIKDEDNKNFNTKTDEGVVDSSRLKENVEGMYLYEKNINKENKFKLFKYDVGLNKNQVCNIHFENKSNQDVTLYIEDIDGNKVSEDTKVEKKSKKSVDFYIPIENLEQDVYTINVKGNSYIEGYLKIDVVPK